MVKAHRFQFVRRVLENSGCHGGRPQPYLANAARRPAGRVATLTAVFLPGSVSGNGRKQRPLGGWEALFQEKGREGGAWGHVTGRLLHWSVRARRGRVGAGAERHMARPSQALALVAPRKQRSAESLQPRWERMGHLTNVSAQPTRPKRIWERVGEGKRRQPARREHALV